MNAPTSVVLVAGNAVSLTGGVVSVDTSVAPHLGEFRSALESPSTHLLSGTFGPSGFTTDASELPAALKAQRSSADSVASGSATAAIAANNSLSGNDSFHYGVYASTQANFGAGVMGVATGGVGFAAGVRGVATGPGAVGVLADSVVSSGTALRANVSDGTAIDARADTGAAVSAQIGVGSAVYAQVVSGPGYAVQAISYNGYAVWAKGESRFDNDVQVHGVPKFPGTGFTLATGHLALFAADLVTCDAACGAHSMSCVQAFDMPGSTASACATAAASSLRLCRCASN